MLHLSLMNLIRDYLSILINYVLLIVIIMTNAMNPLPPPQCLKTLCLVAVLHSSTLTLDRVV